MKICIISKYPPIEGGVSSSTYWLAKGLGEKGHEVHVVTNALEVEDEYREVLDTNDPNYSPKNVYVHSTDPSPTVKANPSHIPFSKIYCEKLASVAVEVIEEHNIQIIDSGYLIPYCISGYLAKSLTNIPHIIRHAGSDLQRLYPSPFLHRLLVKVIQSADTIITNDTKKSFFQNMGVSSSKIATVNRTSVYSQAFNPDVPPMDLSPYITTQKYYPGIPTIAYIGKITHHFETKGLSELLDACGNIEEDFLLVFLVNGKKLDEFRRLVEKADMDGRTLFLNFLPPWQIPHIMKSCTCLVSLEKETSPVIDYHIPRIPAEALATGRCVLMSEIVHKKEPYDKLTDGKDVFVVNPNNVNKICETLSNLIKNPDIANIVGDNGYIATKNYIEFNEYLNKTIGLYQLSFIKKEI